MRFLRVILCNAIVLAGCASPRDIEKQSNFDLCLLATMGSSRTVDRSRAEIEVRRLIEPGEWALIENRDVQIGMTECAALAAIYDSSNVRTLNGQYRFEDYNAYIVEAPDPASPPPSYTAWVYNRAYGRRAPPVKRKYVPKYLITVNEGRVVECNSVDFFKVGKTEDYGELFPHPCMKNVPGF